MKPAKLSTQQKLRERCDILARVVTGIAPIHADASTTDNQRHLLETIIGAAIWYFPHMPQLWTGAISVEALASYLPQSGSEKPRLTADHAFPRKVAARELLQFDWQSESDPGSRVLQLYLEKYGRFNLVTPKENRTLVKYQKGVAFQTPEAAYDAAGIALVTVTVGDLALVKRRDEATISRLMRQEEPEKPPNNGMQLT